MVNAPVTVVLPAVFFSQGVQYLRGFVRAKFLRYKMHSCVWQNAGEDMVVSTSNSVSRPLGCDQSRYTRTEHAAKRIVMVCFDQQSVLSVLSQAGVDVDGHNMLCRG